MQYRIEVYDAWGRRRGVIEDTPLLDLSAGTPDLGDSLLGLIPCNDLRPQPGWFVESYLDDRFFHRCRIDAVRPEWGDSRKLILDKYVSFHEILAIEASGPVETRNAKVVCAYSNREITAIVRDLVQRAAGPLHYTVAHGAYPDGAEREFAKFEARQYSENELGVGSIDTGQWLGAERIDASAAYAKDGDTIAGLVVDGVAWPDLRMMLIDAEESSRNSHAIKRHPEVEGWSDATYAASGYKRKADAATAFLQGLIDSHGIDFIELNPHRDAAGLFDDRVDAYGRYLGLVYGGGQCFNAALVEQHLADVYLYEDGAYLSPELALKDFYSYSAPHQDSLENTTTVLTALDVKAGVLEVLSALAYAAGGFIFRTGAEDTLHFRRADQVDHVLSFDSEVMSVGLSLETTHLCNYLSLEGNPLSFPDGAGQGRSESMDAFGVHSKTLEYFGISHASDAAYLLEGLLDDLAYPDRAWELCFFQGRSDLRQGDLVELRGEVFEGFHDTLAQQWGGVFGDRFVGRIQEVRHRLTGKRVETRCRISSPLRSVSQPLSYMVRRQEAAATFFEFRLDDPTVGLDMGFHLG